MILGRPEIREETRFTLYKIESLQKYKKYTQVVRSLRGCEHTWFSRNWHVGDSQLVDWEQDQTSNCQAGRVESIPGEL